MHHRGEHLGHFFLGDKEDGEAFTAEDEEILVLFASQAATAIANARTHRDVEQARANLEALVETSPVGVVVLDAATGRAVSVNREARRIAEEIRTPGCPTEQLLDVVTCRRADGREISFEELPLVHQLGGSTGTRAEEIELSVPDGRSVRTLVNSTPIRSDGGMVVSVVVTMQDLGPLEELERQRAEFLARALSGESPLVFPSRSGGPLAVNAPGARASAHRGGLDAARVPFEHAVVDGRIRRPGGGRGGLPRPSSAKQGCSGVSAIPPAGAPCRGSPGVERLRHIA